MRGRTNIVARPTPIVNGDLKEFTVSSDGPVEIGDFVEVSYKLNYDFTLFENRLTKLAVKIGDTNYYIISYKPGSRTNDQITAANLIYGKYAVGIFKFENYALQLVSDVYMTDLNVVENLFSYRDEYFCLSGVAGQENELINCKFKLTIMKVNLETLELSFIDGYTSQATLIKGQETINLNEKWYYAMYAYCSNTSIYVAYAYTNTIGIAVMHISNNTLAVDSENNNVYDKFYDEIPVLHYMFPVAYNKILLLVDVMNNPDNGNVRGNIIRQIELNNDGSIKSNNQISNDYYSDTPKAWKPFLMDFTSGLWSDGCGNFLIGSTVMTRINNFTNSGQPPLRIEGNNVIDVYSTYTSTNTTASLIDAKNTPTRMQYLKLNPSNLEYISKSINLLDANGNGLGIINDYMTCFSACKITGNIYFVLINKGYYCFALSDDGIEEGFPGKHDMVKKYTGDGTCLGFTKEAGQPGDVIKVYVPKI